jgi:iron complex outermembrane recepter protein
MIRKILFFSFLLACSISAMAQKQTVSGVIKDALTGETVVGANILIKGTQTGTSTDVNGNFSMQMAKGKYTLQISYVGFLPLSEDIVVADKPQFLTFKLETITLNEVTVTGDVARSRETPVAFTTILPAKLEERLSGQDIPMILNKTPGVYATQQGGGDGDARITIRGFNQRNVGVLLDGIPVNDMENGWVYWSNWFGLDAVTRNIQVQRGLGASKLGLPSVGGTMNIMTKGIETKRSASIEQGVDFEGKLTTNLGYTSGQLKNGWGVSLAAAYKAGNGWVDQTNVKAYFFFAKIDKRWGKHITSLTGFGAPQTHKQRSYKRGLADYDTTYAKEHGVTSADFHDKDGVLNIVNRGINYSQHWGYLKRDADQWNSDFTERIIDPTAPTKVQNEMTNTYFKPQFSIRDSWNVNDRFTLVNTMYLSMGTGGGEQPRTSLKNENLFTASDAPSPDQIGQINWQSLYDQNSKPVAGPFGETKHIDPLYDDKLYYSLNYLVQNNNNHVWFGLLSTFTNKINKKLELSGGIDLRSYTASHYSEITDLLGGDYAIDRLDYRNDYAANPSLAVKHVGDKVSYYDVGMVNWGGVFSQLEYKSGKVSTFINLSSSISGYKKKAYFYNTESGWKYKPGFTVKTGLNYNLSQHSNVFGNIGYLSKTKDYKYFFKGYTSDFNANVKNEKVQALELGYAFTSKTLTANLNAYYTKWQNKPTNQVQGKYEDPVSGEKDTYGDIPGMDALHTGIEFDFIYKILPNLDFQGLISLGNWVWDKKIDSLQMYIVNTTTPANVISFDATGIHVGDAAQTQLGTSIRYEPIKGLYIENGVTFFDRYYADFNPEQCTDPQGNPVDSWRIPAYALLDMHAGYRFKMKTFEKLSFALKLNLLNVLDKMYVSDAKNNDSYIQNSTFNSFDARSAAVFMGAGRQFTASFKIIFN